MDGVLVTTGRWVLLVVQEQLFYYNLPTKLLSQVQKQQEDSGMMLARTPCPRRQFTGKKQIQRRQHIRKKQHNSMQKGEHL
jgi:hypothetical protein